VSIARIGPRYVLIVNSDLGSVGNDNLDPSDEEFISSVEDSLDNLRQELESIPVSAWSFEFWCGSIENDGKDGSL
ncbi:Hypothetical protein HVR_LOCUS1222, partial [uncultured virus]